jgi:hypothetical protein
MSIHGFFSALKGSTTLIISTGSLLVIPTLGFWALCLLWYKHPDYYNEVWYSKFELCGRLWLLASFFSTLIVTGVILYSFIFDKRYNFLRTDRRFKSYVLAIGIFVILIPLSGILVTLLFPSANGAIWIMKLMALATAFWMWFFDYRILRIVKVRDESLKDEFTNTVWLIDCPTSMAIAFVIILSYLYLYWFLPFNSVPGQANSVHDSEAFVMGLSCGAVAVELWFANFLFWFLFGRNEDEIKPIAEGERLNGQ